MDPSFLAGSLHSGTGEIFNFGPLTLTCSPVNCKGTGRILSLVLAGVTP